MGTKGRSANNGALVLYSFSVGGVHVLVHAVMGRPPRLITITLLVLVVGEVACELAWIDIMCAMMLGRRFACLSSRSGPELGV